jgi:hypothetical protein
MRAAHGGPGEEPSVNAGAAGYLAPLPGEVEETVLLHNKTEPRMAKVPLPMGPGPNSQVGRSVCGVGRPVGCPLSSPCTRHRVQGMACAQFRTKYATFRPPVGALPVSRIVNEPAPGTAAFTYTVLFC